MVTSADKALLPDGLRDSLPPAAGHEAAVHEALLATFVARGYERVDPPLVEFEDSLLDGAGDSVALSTFRLMDPVSQKMMGVRADMTPQVARIALTRLRKAPRPLRLCYGGSVLRVRGSQLQPEREFRQAGVELLGADETTADIEVILLAKEALQAAGAQRLTVDLTLPALVPAVFDRFKLDDGVRAELRTMLARKDAAGVAEIGGKAAGDLKILLAASGSAAAALASLADISFAGKAASELARLVDVVAALEQKAPDLAITVDPVENRGFEYHSGLSFTFFAGDGRAAPAADRRRPNRERDAARAGLDHRRVAGRGPGFAGRGAAAQLLPLPGRWRDRGERRKGETVVTNVVVIGSQWGDEGKGKIVDWLSERADVVVRFQGGHNAGHTLVIDGEVYKLSLLPSGVVRPDKISIIGNGVVVDPWALLDELARLAGQGVVLTPESLKLAENAALILPLHSELDRARETARGKGKLGTTGRGIGPAYEDKTARRAIRVCDLADEAVLESKIDELLIHHNALLRGFGEAEIDRAALLADLKAVAPKILPYACATWRLLNEARRDGKRILFEGAQGIMLDVDHGTYPYVTSSNTVAGQAATGSGTGFQAAGYVLGITKAYTTRVGSGPFPTELEDETGKALGERGHEFGTVTGRQRRCGWFDAVLVRQAVKVGGMDGIALTKLDVLDGFDELKVCVGYRIDGQRYDYLPASMKQQAAAEPIYETMEGWSDSTQGARSWAALPATAVKYIRRIEELIETPVALLSTSPEREDTILVRDPFAG